MAAAFKGNTPHHCSVAQNHAWPVSAGGPEAVKGPAEPRTLDIHCSQYNLTSTLPGLDHVRC